MSDSGSTYELPREYWGVTMANRVPGFDIGLRGRYQGALQRRALAYGLQWDVPASKVYRVPRGVAWADLYAKLDAIIADTPVSEYPSDSETRVTVEQP